MVKLTEDRVQPPEGMQEDELEVWHSIVNSLPPEYFRPGDIPLLRAYCASYSLYLEALQMIRDDGMVINVSVGAGSKTRDIAHPAKDMLTSQANAMSAIASKLRLCPSARMVNSKSQTLNNRGTKAAKKPWEEGRTGTDG